MLHAITRDNIYEALLEAVPEIQQEYNEWVELSDGDDPGLYVILGCCLLPFLRPLLDDDGDDSTEPLRRIYTFVEQAATSGNVYIEDAIAIEICEDLLGEINIMRRTKAWRFMGDATKQMYNEMEDARNNVPKTV